MVTRRQQSTDPSAGQGVPRSSAALLAVVGVASALAVGDLVAGLVSLSSSPFLAVGAQFIRLTPEWLKQFAIATFGVWDKVALLVGMAVAILAVAVAAGLASRRRASPGVAVIVVLGVLGAAATVAAPTFSLRDLAAPAAALVVGTGVFAVLHRLAVRWADSTAGARTTAPDVVGPGSVRRSAGPTRRRLVLGTAAGIVGAIGAGILGRVLAGAGGVEASRAAVGGLAPAGGSGPTAVPPVSADFAASGTPTWLTSNRDFYRIDVALQVPRVSTADYVLRVRGMVDRELRLSYDDLRARTLIEAPITMTCVSNEVGGNLMSNAVFVGVPLRELLAEAGVRPGAEQLASTSVDGFTTGTPVAAVTDGRAAMLALAMNGEPLPLEHGFPVRMAVPGLYGYVSGCKWLTDIEVTTFAGFASFWEQRAWAEQAPIKTQSRIDAPRREAVVAAGAVTVAGTAWAQRVGIDRVEVRVDQGAWRAAELASEVSIDTWRMWRTGVDLAPGRHRLQVRATDRTGSVQTSLTRPTIPDGATGWHTITVTAT